jgi:hypothetical protein
MTGRKVTKADEALATAVAQYDQAAARHDQWLALAGEPGMLHADEACPQCAGRNSGDCTECLGSGQVRVYGTGNTWDDVAPVDSQWMQRFR